LLLDRQGTVKVLDLGLARLSGAAGKWKNEREPAASASATELVANLHKTAGESGLGDSAANLTKPGEGLMRGHIGIDQKQREDTAPPGLTGSGVVMGTVDYLAPEQALDARQADQRADIYSLGCTLHFLLTGRSPAPDGSLLDKLTWHQAGPVLSLRAARADVPTELDVICKRMLAKSPHDRYQSMGEVIRALEACQTTTLLPKSGFVSRWRRVAIVAAVAAMSAALIVLTAWSLSLALVNC